MMNKGTAIVGFIICFLAGMALMYGFDHSKKGYDLTADVGGAWSDRDSPVPIDSKDPVWGSRTAPVTMVVYSDFQCPFCSRVEGTVDQIKQTYGKDKIRIIWKNSPLPFHPNAKPAAEAAGFTCERADEIRHSGVIDVPMYEQLLKAARATLDR